MKDAPPLVIWCGKVAGISARLRVVVRGVAAGEGAAPVTVERESVDAMGCASWRPADAGEDKGAFSPWCLTLEEVARERYRDDLDAICRAEAPELEPEPIDPENH